MSDIILYTLVIFIAGFFCGSKFGSMTEMGNSIKAKVKDTFSKE
jgi:hypothetical protein